jgi:hypothetical protein
VLLKSGQAMSALDVCNTIQRTVPALLSRHRDPMVTINIILSRLMKYGEARVLVSDCGQRAWVWAAGREGGPNGEGPQAQLRKRLRLRAARCSLNCSAVLACFSFSH